MKRRYSMPFGAECRDDGSVRLRLWAPAAREKKNSTAAIIAAGKTFRSRTFSTPTGHFTQNPVPGILSVIDSITLSAR
jgi:hypothetical protein